MIPPEDIRAQLSRILASKSFAQADRASRFLGFVVSNSLDGRAGELKESVIAVEALGRTTSFDAKSDPIVRVEAGRLRNRLKSYYDSEGLHDAILITLPKGGYVPEFEKREPRPAVSNTRNSLTTGAIGLLAGLIIAFLAYRMLDQRTALEMPLRLSLIPPPNASIESSRISPDGTMVAFTARQQNSSALWVRPLNSPAARLIPGTERATQMFWSPDSHAIAFFGPDRLRKVELSGGPAQDICTATIPLGGGSWSKDGIIIFSPRPEGPLFRVPAAGGTPQPVTSLDKSRGETIHRSPEFLPDGRHFLYVASSGRPDGMALRVGSLDATGSKVLLEAVGNAVYAPPAQGQPGSLLFYFHGALLAQSFDPGKLTFTGVRKVIAPEVLYRKGRADFSTSSNGVLAYRAAIGKELQLGWFDRAGRSLGAVGSRNDYFAVRLSPDEKELAFSEDEDFRSNASIWVMDLDRGAVSKAADLSPASFMPVWSPDGEEIVFSNGNEQRMRLLLLRDHQSKPTTLLETQGPKFPTDWSSDGRFITYFTPWPEFARLKTMILDLRKPAGGTNTAALFMESQFNEAEAVSSPEVTKDGPRWLAYTSTETGRPEVYVRTFPQGDHKWAISNGGAWQPLWRRDGRELFFLSQDGVLQSAEVSGGPRFLSGVPHPLFRTTIPAYSGAPEVPAHSYAASEDGQRFLVNQRVDSPQSDAISIVTRWQAPIAATN